MISKKQNRKRLTKKTLIDEQDSRIGHRLEEMDERYIEIPDGCELSVYRLRNKKSNGSNTVYIQTYHPSFDGLLIYDSVEEKIESKDYFCERITKNAGFVLYNICAGSGLDAGGTATILKAPETVKNWIYPSRRFIFIMLQFNPIINDITVDQICLQILERMSSLRFNEDTGVFVMSENQENIVDDLMLAGVLRIDNEALLRETGVKEMFSDIKFAVVDYSKITESDSETEVD